MWQTVGQNRAVSLLQCSLERQAVAHAYLFVGPPQVGKMTLALDLAKALNCGAPEPPCGECASCRKIAAGKHADVQVIDLEGGRNSGEARLQTGISIDQIRAMQHAASLPPFEGKFKVFIIDGAELMSHEAANCLLKTLEEPVGRVIFVLLAAGERPLLATIVSRCQRLELPPLSTAEVEAALSSRCSLETPRADLLARLSGGCLGWALNAVLDDSPLKQRAERLERLLKVVSGDGEERLDYALQLATQFGQNREAVTEILHLWLGWWRDLLLIKAGCGGLITNTDLEDTLTGRAGDYTLLEIRDFIAGIQAALEQLKQNANPQLVLEVLMLSLPRRVG